MTELQEAMDNRAIDMALYMLTTKATLKETGEKFSISGTQVHSHVTRRLSKVAPNLAIKVKELLKHNQSTSYLRQENNPYANK